tara:strand:- start:514863 stop:515645 length:783 start_codon:yes stop_codon:yes gene_type:complete
MINALRVAATGMAAQQKNVDVLSNNIANISTTSFKRSEASFTDLMYSNQVAVGATTSAQGTLAPTGSQIGMGVRLGSTYRVQTQGPVEETGDTFSMAIQGRGFFEIQLPNGDRAYTRDGNFRVNQNGDIVNKDGYLLQPAINIPEDAVNITITPRGQVSGLVNQQAVDFGEIELVMFQNEAGLETLGENLLRETEVSGAPVIGEPGEDGAGTLLQGFIERSNVDPVQEITRLITAQRAYELNSRVISTADEMMSAVNQIR